ncbi:MAG: D-Ala-D-Ala carboxypeptidase family metallohydrolase [Beijerinckiaceae bacterium]|nr:D-Ala-D-Ala carboxypeptidase family metallohydrolase [Beijerinckiaceae bacterium]
MQASYTPDVAEGAAIGQASENEPISQSSIGLASFFAPSPQVQVAEVLENIPGDFKAPENPPVPPARPDFGDRVQLAAVPASVAATATGAPEQAVRLTAADITGSTASITNTQPQTTTRAEAASLGAYEFKTAGAPLPNSGLRATNIAYAPAQFELAGAASSIGRMGGLRWRAAYDDVHTDCFPETLRAALDQIAAHFKSEVLVTSGRRDRGRRGSLHRSCKAADIRVVGVSPGEVARVARNIPGVNGVGTYRRVAVTHIDVRAERFAWRW